MTTERARHVLSPSTAQPYTSFLLRCWTLEGRKRRIKVEHVQSGEWTQVGTLTDAAGWMEGQCGVTGDGAREHFGGLGLTEDTVRHGKVNEEEIRADKC